MYHGPGVAVKHDVMERAQAMKKVHTQRKKLNTKENKQKHQHLGNDAPSHSFSVLC